MFETIVDRGALPRAPARGDGSGGGGLLRATGTREARRSTRSLLLWAVIAASLPSAQLASAAPPLEPVGNPSASGVLQAQPRRPLPFILSAPSGEVTNTSSSEIIRIVSELIETQTRFDLEITDPRVVTDCIGSMSCLAESVRPDANAPHAPPFLLILSQVAVPGQADRLSASLIDLDVAQAVLAHAPRREKGWEREADAEITERASLLDAERASVENSLATQAFLERLVLEKLARVWRQTGDWMPFGTLELEVSVPGASVTLDGARLGATIAGVTRIENVEHGLHRLTLEHPQFTPFTRELEVPRGEVLRVQVELVELSRAAALAYSGAVWGGAALATAGSVILVFAIGRHDGSVHSACFRDAVGPCQSSRTFETFGYDPSAVDDSREVNPRGLKVAPLGYGLAATGLVWSLGTLLFGERERPPWIPLGVGVVAGVLSYGLSTALDGDRPR